MARCPVDGGPSLATLVLDGGAPVPPTISALEAKRKEEEKKAAKFQVDIDVALLWCPESATFWVNASRVLPPLTISNVKNPGIFIFFFKEKNLFFSKKKKEKRKKK